MTSPTDRGPRIRFRLREVMIATAVLAVAMAGARWEPGLGVLVVLLAFVYPLLTETDDDGRSRRARPDLSRVAFAYMAGVVLPFLCLYFDPIVFQSTSLGPYIQGYRHSCYVFIAFEMALLSAWLWSSAGPGRLRPFLAGAFRAGAVFAFGIGLLISPLSLIGISFLGLGLLGLTPFFTAFVFLREAGLVAPLRGASPASLGRQGAGAALAIGLWIGAHLLLDR